MLCVSRRFLFRSQFLRACQCRFRTFRRTDNVHNSPCPRMPMFLPHWPCMLYDADPARSGSSTSPYTLNSVSSNSKCLTLLAGRGNLAQADVICFLAHSMILNVLRSKVLHDSFAHRLCPNPSSESVLAPEAFRQWGLPVSGALCASR